MKRLIAILALASVVTIHTATVAAASPAPAPKLTASQIFNNAVADTQVVTSLTTNYNALNLTTGNISKSLLAVQSDVALLKSQQTQLSGLSLLQQQVATNTGEISGLKSGYAGITTSVSALQSDINTVKNQMVQPADFHSVQSTVASNISDINILKNDVTGLKNTVAVLATDNTATKLDISALKLSQDKLELIPGVQSSISDVTLAVSQIQANFLTLATNLKNVQTDVSNLKSAQVGTDHRLTTLESQALRTPVIRDNANNILGSLVSINHPGDQGYYEFYSGIANAIIGINTETGLLVGDGTRVIWSNSDCTGQAYATSRAPYTLFKAGSLDRYFVVDNFKQIPGFTYYSSTTEYGGCQATSYPLIMSNAVSLREVQLPFSLPVATPIRVTPSY